MPKKLEITAWAVILMNNIWMTKDNARIFKTKQIALKEYPYHKIIKVKIKEL